MSNTGSKQIQIPFSHPRFNLMFLSMDSSNDTLDAVLNVARNGSEETTVTTTDSAVKTNKLNSSDEERFFENLRHCNLSEVQTAFCQRAKTVLNISAVRTGSSFFAPFWACHAAAQELAESLSSICVDMYQGSAFSATQELAQHNANGVPLAGTFLTVKAYQKESSNKFFLCTEGMARFGLPELTLTEVPSNLGSDGAYLLRTIAQYIWTKLDNVHPEQPYLSIDETNEISAVYCEFNNPAFHAAPELNIPFALEVFESKHETVLVVRPPSGYDDYYDWFLSVTESIVEHRLRIQRAEAAQAVSREEQPASLAAA